MLAILADSYPAGFNMKNTVIPAHAEAMTASPSRFHLLLRTSASLSI
jgi:hypothetical protein